MSEELKGKPRTDLFWCETIFEPTTIPVNGQPCNILHSKLRYCRATPSWRWWELPKLLLSKLFPERIGWNSWKVTCSFDPPEVAA